MLGHQCLPSLKLMFVARLSPWLVELRFALKASINVFDSLQGLLCTAGFILFCHWGSGRTSGPSHSDIEMSEEEEQESQEVCDEPSVSIAYKLEVAFHGSKPVPIPSSFVVEDDEGKKYLKIQGSAPWLSRLLCKCSNRETSLDNGPKLSDLKKKRNEQLQPKSSDGNNVAEKKMKAPQVVCIDVRNTQVQILCHKSEHSRQICWPCFRKTIWHLSLNIWKVIVQVKRLGGPTRRVGSLLRVWRRTSDWHWAIWHLAR